MNQRRLSRHKSCALYHDIVCTLLWQESLASSLGSGQGALEAVLGLDAIDAVCGVEVLDDDDLEAGGGALSRGDGRVGQEDFPDLSLSVSVFVKCSVERTLNQRSPYLALTFSAFPSQFLYHRQRVPE